MKSTRLMLEPVSKMDFCCNLFPYLRRFVLGRKNPQRPAEGPPPGFCSLRPCGVSMGIDFATKPFLRPVLFFIVASCTKYQEVSNPQKMTMPSLEQQVSYTPAPGDLSPEGFNWVHRDYALILSGAVYEHNGKGIIREEVITKRKPELEKYLESMSKVDRKAFESWSKENQVSFLINAYHASFLKIVAEEGLKKVSSATMKKPSILVFGETYSMDSLIKKELRGKFEDPRIFLSLFCFEKYCPEFRNRIINFKNIDAELSVNTVRFVRNPEKNYFDKRAKKIILSPLLQENEKLIVKKYGSMRDFLEGVLGDKESIDLLKKVKPKYSQIKSN